MCDHHVGFLLNRPSPFRPYDRVCVSETRNRDEPAQVGTVYMKVMAPVNAALADGDQTDHIYVAFDDRGVYARWLQRGSTILNDGATTPYVVDTIHRAKDGTVTSLDIYPYSLTNLRPVVHNISLNQIHAMLIWLVAYEMKLLSEV